MGGLLQRRKRDNHSDTSVSETYRAGDQLVHTMAFASGSVMRIASSLDNLVFAHSISKTEQAAPVFVTSLPRGGTTAVLNALDSLRSVATHRYRDMPFITAPLLWDLFGSGSARQVAKRQRAHGDGIEIDLESPEAFDEVLWRLYWPGKYDRGSISLWGSDDIDPNKRIGCGGTSRRSSSSGGRMRRRRGRYTTYQRTTRT